jgi:hypothetical protein
MTHRQLSSSVHPLRAACVSAMALTVVLLGAACGGSDGSPTSPSTGGSGQSSTVTSITLGVPAAAQVGGTLQVAAFAQYSNLTAGDITRTATWSSSNTQVATLTSLGGFPAFQLLRTGTVTITAAFGGRSASQTVVVQ